MPGHLVSGRYRLQTMLGRGGTAIVWRGVDTRLDRVVAIKTLDAVGADPTMLASLDREARTVARLAHPNIVTVHDLGVDDGVPYLVMELVEGTDLQQRLAHGPLEVGQAVEIATQVCAALAAAHDAGVIHRDIKPGNILLSTSGTVKVCDFGIARAQAAHAGATRLEATVGTSAYMAPEQATGDPVDARTDLYALGCVLYAMLTGGPPFHGDNPMHVLWQHVHQPAPSVASHRSDIPADLDALLRDLLAKNPADRPASATHVRARLAHLRGQPATAVLDRVTAPLPNAARSARASAPVFAPTRSLPVVDATDNSVPARGGIRLGPAGIAAVAVGAAVLAVVVIAVLTLFTGQQTPQAGPPATAASSPTATTPTGSPSPTDTGTMSFGEDPTGQINNIQAILNSQVQAGNIENNAAQELAAGLNEVTNYVAAGDTSGAAEKAAEVRNKLSELRHDHQKISKDAYQELSTALASLVDTLRPGNNDNN